MWTLAACAPSSGGFVEQPPDAGPPAPDAAPPPPAALVPGAAATVRLTRAQYTHIIADVFGEAIVVPGPLEPDVALDGLWAIGAGSSTISPGASSSTRPPPSPSPSRWQRPRPTASWAAIWESTPASRPPSPASAAASGAAR
ncbi:MAG: hypothetical protein R3F60_31515 [bacterium]